MHVIQVWEGEDDFKTARIFDGFDESSSLPSQSRFPDSTHHVARFGYGVLREYCPQAIGTNKLAIFSNLDWDTLESLPDHALKRVDILLADNDKLHPPSAVLSVPPLDQLFARVFAGLLGACPEGFEVSGTKLAVDMSGFGQMFGELELTLQRVRTESMALFTYPHVLLQVLLVLRVDGVAFPLRTVLPNQTLPQH